ncbi:MAG: Terminase-like family protein [Smithella sp. PtaU1.Bin162]|nr:MAG: Terminase-like family protein [Smithella sp. PtaU1.Bin162]
MIIKPQPGFQEEFLSSSADIVIGGGAAGAGKSYALLIEPIRNIKTKNFGAVIFRRESTQISSEGGLWDTAHDLYMPFNPDFVESPRHVVKFKKYKSKITFAHLQHEKHVYGWDGSQIALLGFDELQHFSEKQFWYMFSRNRSVCGVPAYCRCTCNPDPDSFLRDLLSWWINQETGDPILERSGLIRFFVRIEGKIIWGKSKEELENKYKGVDAKSITFIMGTLEQNKILMEMNPGYKANIDSLLDYERRRLMGNWFARPSAGELFKRQDFIPIDGIDRADIMGSIRYWDQAATEPSELNPDPDWTASVLMHEMSDGSFVIEDAARTRQNPGGVEKFMDHYKKMDDPNTVIGIEQEPGSSGKIESYNVKERYPDRVVETFPKTVNKLTSWKPLSRAVARGEIKFIKGPWNQDFFNELENVTDGTQKGHDDFADAAAGAYNYFTSFLDFGVGDYK